MQTLYTFGYLSSKGSRILSELVAVKTPIIDVRYNPTSKRYEWKQETLRASLGALYMWIQELGNEWYKQALTGKFTEPHIKLSSPEQGIAKLKSVLDAHGRAAIFCACANKTACHRIAVADLAKDSLAVQVIHL